jgi:LacI family transcriptional regulator
MEPKSRRAHGTAATVADVAVRAACSPMTVSRVMNGAGNVRDSTRDKVLKAAAELNYSPNLAARSLAASGQSSIGLLYSNPSPAYLSRFLLGCLEEARSNHVQLIVEDCGVGQEKEEAGLRELIATGVDGIILSPPLCDRNYILDILASSNIPAVAVANWQPDRALSVVRIDDNKAAAEMTKFIIEQGHRSIGFIVGHSEQKASQERLDGFKAALQEANITFDPSLIIQGDFTYRSGLAAAEILLTRDDAPTAIFASNDDMAAATIAMAHRLHIDVPDALTVCGFDNTDIAQSIWPELTTIDQPVAAMSKEAIRMLIDQMRSGRTGISENLEQRIFDFKLITRGSHASIGS